MSCVTVELHVKKTLFTVTILVRTEIRTLTTGVYKKTDNVKQWRVVVNSSHCAPVVRSISHLCTVYFQSTISSQVNSV